MCEVFSCKIKKARLYTTMDLERRNQKTIIRYYERVDEMTDKNANYWKVEAIEHGNLKAGNIDHLKPDHDTRIYLMERKGEI